MLRYVTKVDDTHVVFNGTCNIKVSESELRVKEDAPVTYTYKVPNGEYNITKRGLGINKTPYKGFHLAELVLLLEVCKVIQIEGKGE